MSRSPQTTPAEVRPPTARACEHTFLTSQGHPHARFRRAIDTGNATIALAAAHELPQLGLGDALSLCLVLRGGDPERHSRACARWLCRYGLEVPGVGLEELRFVAACLAALPQQHVSAAARGLEDLAARRGLADVAEALRRARAMPP